MGCSRNGGMDGGTEWNDVVNEVVGCVGIVGTTRYRLS